MIKVSLWVQTQFLRVASSVFLLGLAFFVLSVHSQETENESTSKTELEELVVTGSRIGKSELEGSSPMQVLDFAFIAKSGQTSVGQLLREIPSVAGGAQTTQVNYNGDGTNQISLRGLGSDRTLVLMNGRRLPPSTTGLSSTSISSVVDLNTIPISIVERIEVIKDGASAIYGSDAVAGVVNIVTRRDFEGLSLNLQTGTTQEGDGARNLIDFTFGDNNEHSAYTFFAGYVDEQAICACDREWAATPLAYFGEDVIFLGSTAPPWGRYVFSDDGQDYDLTRGPEFGDFRPFSFFGGDSYNFAPVNHQRQPSTRWSMMFSGDRTLSDSMGMRDLRAFISASYLNRDGNQKIAPNPLAPLAFFAFDAPYSKDNFFNPFGVDVPDWRRRMVEGGARILDVVTQTKQVTIGIEGRAGDWRWNAYHAFGETASRGNFGRVYDLHKVANAVGPSLRDESGEWLLDADGNPMCANDTANCVVLNVFSENSVTSDMLSYLTFVDNQSSLQDQKVFGFDVVNSALVTRVAGPIGIAAGWEWREERGVDHPDSLVNTLGDAATGFPRKPTSGSYSANEVYAELNVPVAAQLDFVNLLEVNFAVRYSDYDSFGETTNSKFGLKYRPIDDLMIRASYSQAFRAPSISNLFGGNGFEYPALVDPCSQNPTQFCIDDGVPPTGFQPISTQIRTTIGGNPSAQPETAEIQTFGLVYRPWTNLSITVDRFDVALTDALTTLGASFILDQCATTGNFCNLIDRFSAGTLAGNPVNVQNTVTNVGGVDTSGWDFAVDYVWHSDFFGDVALRYEASLLNEYRITRADQTTTDLTGRFVDDLDGYFTEYRSSAIVQVTHNNFEMSYQMRVIGEAEEDFTDFLTGNSLQRTVEGRIYHNIFASLALPEHKLSLSGGINNLLNEDPPLSLDGLNDNTDVRTFDTAGRYFFFRVNYSM
ncbi:MAG: TonB-dependent receptor [Gammaproteobacteria bacterium]|nr:TonB-dependent receptor [Gammaproteobacteria bacterium]MYF37238.1 TonB-dependent receptor [Gammaproteobacteria bacterium]